MRKLIAILCALGVAVLSAGCSGGSIYSNYRDIAELMIVQTLGFDSMPDGGVTVSVSAEGSSGAGSEDGSKKPEPERKRGLADRGAGRASALQRRTSAVFRPHGVFLARRGRPEHGHGSVFRLH